MLMTEIEITSNVRRNGGTKNQLRLLSELNSCSPEDIEEILRKHDFVQDDKGVWWTKSEYEKIKNKSVERKPAVKKQSKEKKSRLLSDIQKAQIWEMYSAGGISYDALAEQYGVSTYIIGEVIRNHKRGTEPIFAEIEALSEIRKKEEPFNFDACFKAMDRETLDLLISDIRSRIVKKESELQNLHNFLDALSKY